MKKNRRPSVRSSRKPPHAATAHPGDRVTLGELRAMMRQFVGERQWEKYHIPRNLAASVAVEAGELLELFQWWTESEGARVKREVAADREFRRAVGEEMTDVLMYLMSLANAMDLDIGSAIYAKMEKNRSKYPPEKVLGHYARVKDPTSS